MHTLLALCSAPVARTARRALMLYSILALSNLLSPSLHAQSPTVLNPGGSTVRLDTLRDGNYTVSQGTIVMGTDGMPQLVSSKAAPPHGDSCWSEMFAPNGVIGRVNAIAVAGNDIYIGGSFTVVANTIASNLARWNTASKRWSHVEGDAADGTSGTINALIVHNDDLYIGGAFQYAGGIESPGIVRYNTSARRWFRLGEGILRTAVGQVAVVTDYGEVFAFALEKNTLYVGGEFLTVDDQGIPNFVEYDIVNNTWRKPCRLAAQSPNSAVRAILVRDSAVYIGGSFTAVGTTSANRVAKLDLRTSTISSMGNGFNAAVLALAFHDGKIIAGGSFTASGTTSANHLAAWNGSAWSEYAGGTTNTVYALLSFQGALFVSGTFDRAGSVSSSSIASYNNGIWSALSGGLTDSVAPVGRALASDGATVFSGGTFSAAGNVNVSAIAGWNGSAWTALGGTPATNFNGTDGPVYAIARSGSNIFVAGDFLNAGGIPANRVARFDLAAELWSPLAQGANAPGSLTRALAVDDDGFLYLGGIFSSISGVPALGIARWDGSAWNALGSGLAGTTPYVFSLLAASDSIIVGGAFESAGGAPSQKVAIWRRAAQQWQSVGTGITGDTVFSFVSALGLHQGRLYAGGLFSKVGTTAARNVAQFDGSLWQPMAKGLNGRVSALASMADGLYAGGEFTKSDTAAMASIARWDGLKWSSVAGGTNGIVNALLPLEGNKLLVLGDFTSAGGSAHGLAIWDPSRTDWNSPPGESNVQVRAGAAAGGAYYLGGDFTRINSTRANFAARLSLGEASALGSDPTIGLDDSVLALEFDTQGQLFAGGVFGTAGGARVNGIARWSGTRWLSVGEPLRGVRREVHALASRSDGTIIAGGMFDSIGTRKAGSIAVWDGFSWQLLGIGVRNGNASGVVNAVAVDGSGIVAGGQFTTADSLPVNDVARWSGTSWSPLVTSGAMLRGGGRGEVRAVGVLDGGYLVGGKFDTLGGTPVRALAWINRSGGAPQVVHTFNNTDTLPGVSIYAGPIIRVGNELLVTINRDVMRIRYDSVVHIPLDTNYDEFHSIYRYDGTNLTMVDSGGGDVTSLYFDEHGRLYVVGSFNELQSAIALNFGHLERDGATWQGSIHGFRKFVGGRDVPGRPYAVAVRGDTAWVGGKFMIAGAKPSLYIARWHNCDATLAGVENQSVAASTRSVEIKLWPNPVHAEATVRLVPVERGPLRVDLIDATGRVGRTLYDGTGTEEPMTLTFDVAGLSSGTWFCRVASGSTISIAPLVIER